MSHCAAPCRFLSALLSDWWWDTALSALDSHLNTSIVLCLFLLSLAQFVHELTVSEVAQCNLEVDRNIITLSVCPTNLNFSVHIL